MKNVTLIFNNEISPDTFAELNTLLQDNYSDDTKITLFFSSVGGQIAYIPAFIYLINTYVDTLIGISNIESAGMDIFLYSKPRKKKVYDNTIGAIHLRSHTVERMFNEKIPNEQGYHEIIKKQMKPDYDMYKKLGVNKKDIKKMKEGGIVFIDTKTLKKEVKKYYG